MDCTLFHDSRNTAYRYPFGAVPAGTVVTLRLDVRGTGTEAVFLRLWVHDHEEKVPMQVVWEEPVKDEAAKDDVAAGETAKEALPADEAADGNFAATHSVTGGAEAATEAAKAAPARPRLRRYEAAVPMPADGCLVWYYFLVQAGGRTVYYGNNRAERGGIGLQAGKELPSYQITVYEKDSVTPDWLKHAVFYQIFPDRFCRGPVPADRFQGKRGAVLHSAWDDAPFYMKDANGDIRYYDFFGGTLEGIAAKLDYLADLGVTCLYLNPVFEARSNHRYDTGCYRRVDPFLGGEQALRGLCAAAKARGMRILLDGVFSHTGADSEYFNRFASYPDAGAYQSQTSPYARWYTFHPFPDEYDCWWGDKSLPEVKETEPSYLDYIIYDDDSVLKHWLRAGISGWRLDVADELPDGFLEPFYRELKRTDPDAALIGEVWEDASHKVSYGVQRQYLSGGKLDSVMNYVLRQIMLDFALGKADARETDAAWAQQRENYPRENLYAMMNLLGSHDVERLRTVLEDVLPAPAAKRMEGLLRAWQMTLPGAPAIYYGDEAGLTGHKDPENRGTFPWGREDKERQACCRSLIHLRRAHAALETGRYDTVYAAGDVYIYARFIEGGRDVFGSPAEDGVFFTALNRSAKAQTVTVDTRGLAYGQLVPLWDSERAFGAVEEDAAPADSAAQGEAVAVEPVPVAAGRFTVTLPPRAAVVYQCRETGDEDAPRRAGVLLHPTSLPGKTGRERLQAAKQWIDFLAAAGQSVWQILPLNPPGLGDSPYLSVSAFAGSEDLFDDGRPVDDAAFAAFCDKERYWLDDYALYCALKDEYGGKPWQEWPAPLRRRDKAALQRCEHTLAGAIRACKVRQYRFRRAWQDIRAYAAARGVRIFGDMPIFVATDSADCWAHQEYFYLDGDGYPTEIAGVPPDYFSELGQVWGNPQYRWDVMARDGWQWWVERFRALAELADLVRVDHFRGFAATWAIDAVSRDARQGHWTPGPGKALFETVHRAVPQLHLVAEDLGVITDDVIALRDAFHLPGMRVLQFHLVTRSDGQTAFDTEPNCVAYTGTHDNNTLCGWWTEELDAAARQRVAALAGLPPDAPAAERNRRLIAHLYSRQARLVMVPLQDLLALPAACRMNLPGTATGNWHWQMDAAALTPELAAWLRSLANATGRIPNGD
ncbi:MAG: 4-alpha-glucanotransferase [Succiniclasticum sp.]|nr:4-alpha-glucanotransferase [Succiniclasticum sp.]MEE3479765.1 4-alpha-glucanotransferase [Succiniclasticum sp.]